MSLGTVKDQDFESYQYLKVSSTSVGNCLKKIAQIQVDRWYNMPMTLQFA